MLKTDSLLATGYRHFLAVAEAGSVRAASRSINVAASAISRQIGLLEAQLGLSLFERGRALILTAAGHTLLRALRTAQDANEAAFEELRALKGLAGGRVRIATVESVSVSLLPGLLTRFTAAYPGLDLAVTVAGSDAVTELVREHRADVGLTFNPQSLDGLETAFTREFRVGATLAPAHPLAGAKSLTLEQCLAYRVAWPAPGLSLRTLLDRAARMKGATPPRAVECNSLRLMASLARGGGFIAFQTPIGLEADLASGALHFIPLADRRLPVDRMMAVRRTGAGGGQATAAFLVMARQHLETAT